MKPYPCLQKLHRTISTVPLKFALSKQTHIKDQSYKTYPSFPTSPIQTVSTPRRHFHPPPLVMAPPAVFKPNNTAVITGGASGIGLALAEKCVKYGMNVVICDNNGENLKEAKESLAGKGKGQVEVVEMDVSKVEEFAKVTVCSYQRVDGDPDGNEGAYEDIADPWVV
jgi:hypothetical protein